MLLRRLREGGVTVQSPVKDPDGGDVTRLSDGTLATMLTWIEGRILCKDDLTGELCFALGPLLANMHAALRATPVLAGIRYDAALCQKLAREVDGYLQRGWLPAWAAPALKDALTVIAARLTAQEEAFLPVHSDLSFSNILLTDQGLVPIDFSLYGLGHPMMDMGELFSNIEEAAQRAAVAAGYEAAGGTMDASLADAFFALSILLGVTLHMETWHGEDWFPASLKHWCKTVFVPLASGESMSAEADAFHLVGKQ